MSEKRLRVTGLAQEDILRGVSFEVGSGEILAVMGPSGSGKSTLLYNVAGMERPTSGQVWLGETEVTSLSEDEMARLRLRRIGFIFQQMNMLADLSILDNILLPALQASKGARRPSKAQIAARAETLMRKLGIQGLGGRDISQVSGGQLQRACICRSLMNKPEILLADEPTGALNKGAADEVMEQLEMLNRDGATILMVTHDSAIAARCGRILYLLDGQIAGELALGRRDPARDAERMRHVAQWLMDMGW